jgi:hypothetical protein
VALRRLCLDLGQRGRASQGSEHGGPRASSSFVGGTQGTPGPWGRQQALQRPEVSVTLP